MELTLSNVTILSIGEQQDGTTEKGAWKKVQAVVESPDKYPDKIAVMFWNNEVDDLRKFDLGSKVNITIRPASREWNGKWYTDLTAKSIEEVPNIEAPKAKPEKKQPAKPIEEQPGIDEPDDLPFDFTPAGMPASGGVNFA